MADTDIVILKNPFSYYRHEDDWKRYAVSDIIVQVGCCELNTGWYFCFLLWLLVVVVVMVD